MLIIKTCKHEKITANYAKANSYRTADQNKELEHNIARMLSQYKECSVHPLPRAHAHTHASQNA